MKGQVLHTVWDNISGEAAGEIWNWSLLGAKGLTSNIASSNNPLKNTEHSCWAIMLQSSMNMFGLWPLLWDIFVIFPATQGAGLRSFGLGATTQNPAGTLGASTGFGSGLGAFGVGALGTQSATGFGSLGSSTGGLGTSSGFGTSLGGQTALGSSLGGSTFGQATGTSTGLGFGNTASVSLGGLNTGVAAGTPAFGTQKTFSLQKPPAGNKRGKRR